MTSQTTGLSGAALLMARVATMVSVSCVSFYLVERPLRRADWSRVGGRLHLPPVWVASAGVLVTAVVVLLGTIGPPLAESAPVARSVPGATPAGATLDVSLPAIRIRASVSGLDPR